jgi:hypothetical protein
VLAGEPLAVRRRARREETGIAVRTCAGWMSRKSSTVIPMAVSKPFVVVVFAAVNDMTVVAGDDAARRGGWHNELADLALTPDTWRSRRPPRPSSPS